MGSRANVRHLVRLKVELQGVDSDGNGFRQTVFTHNVSRRGARLLDTPRLLEPAAIVELHHRGRSGRFRVVWVGGFDHDEAGLESLESSQCIWGNPLPGQPITTREPANLGQ